MKLQPVATVQINDIWFLYAQASKYFSLSKLSLNQVQPSRPQRFTGPEGMQAAFQLKPLLSIKIHFRLLSYPIQRWRLHISWTVRVESLLENPPEDREYILLKDIKENGPTTLSDIATRLQVSESTISRQCSRLIGMQWISVETRGKNKIVKLLPTGEIMIRLYTPERKYEI